MSFQLWSTIDIVENLLNILNAVNVLVFLQRGKSVRVVIVFESTTVARYQSLLERLIGLKMVLSQETISEAGPRPPCWPEHWERVDASMDTRRAFHSSFKRTTTLVRDKETQKEAQKKKKIR